MRHNIKNERERLFDYKVSGQYLLILLEHRCEYD